MMPAQSRPPKHLMTLLASLMLNRRLQQRPATVPMGNAYGQNRLSNGRPSNPNQTNRMAELARMQLGLNAPPLSQGRGTGLPPGLIGRPLPPGLARRTTLPPGLM